MMPARSIRLHRDTSPSSRDNFPDCARRVRSLAPGEWHTCNSELHPHSGRVRRGTHLYCCRRPLSQDRMIAPARRASEPERIHPHRMQHWPDRTHRRGKVVWWTPASSVFPVSSILPITHLLDSLFDIRIKSYAHISTGKHHQHHG